MQITIGGMPGSGKSTVAKLIAVKLGYKYYSIGKIRRELAQKRGMTILEYNNLKENTDEEVDNYQKELGEKEDNIVVEGRLGFHFLPKSIKFFFDVDLKIAAKRIFKDPRSSEKKYASEEETYEALKARMENDRERYKRHYNIDAFNPSNYDYVIDTTNISIEEVKNKVLDILQI